MKNFFRPCFGLALLSLLFTASPALAKDHDDKDDRGDHGKHKKHHKDKHDRDYYDDRGRECRSFSRNGNVEVRVFREGDRRVQVRDVRHVYNRGDIEYRSHYPRQVVVYENRSYGYNYYDLQDSLRQGGYYRGPIDGIWGRGSRAALIRYQTDQGWEGNGRVDGRIVVNLGLGY